MTALFGTEYFGFIAGAYGIVTFCLLALVVWILAAQRSRKRELDRLEERGLKRASRAGEVN